MTTILSREDFLRNLRDCGLFSRAEIDSGLGALAGVQAADAEAVAQSLIAAGKLTAFQAAAVRERRFEELVIGHYHVLDRLGVGGMGTVYKAIHRRMKRIVAIKVLSRTVAQSEKFTQRFQREVEAVARLSHPNIVMAYDADEAEVGHFLVMEFVNGRDLASAVQERGPLPIAEAVECIVQAARALDYAHAQGIIHRDIKPANLLRDMQGVVKVADLGLARFNDSVARHEEMSALTQAGTIMGTVDFMPPEQAVGLTTVDHRADIYSLGCTLHYLLIGRPPYQGVSLMATLLLHRDAPIPALRAARKDVPSALDPIFGRMVAKKPEERFASMTEVVHALEALALAPAPPPRHAAQSAVMQTAAPTPTVDITPSAQDTGTAGTDNQTIALTPARTTGTAGMTVLLVEPSRSQAVIIRGYLHKLGIPDIPTTLSGQKALEAARAAPPRVVISAMHLADMTGVQLAQKMQAEAALSSTGFILISSQSDAEETNLLSQAANTVRLHKPFDLDQLAQALSAASGSSEGKGSSTATTSNLRVLLVDDSSAARAYVRSVLAGLGLRHIAEAADGAEAVTLLEKETYDLVVTDYTMPRLDGRGLIDFIRHRSSTPSVPVIVVTTETDPAKLDPLRRLGVSAICNKNLKPELIRGILEGLG